MRKTVRRKGGAPRKVAGGLNRALYVLVNDALLKGLEKVRKNRSKDMGVTLSGADVVRMLLWEELNRIKGR